MQRVIQSKLNFVVIGINHYLHWPALDHAVNDATGVARLFTQLGGEQVIEPLLDGAATRDAVHRLATVDLAHLRPDDSLVIFFAGHGHTHIADFTDMSVKTGYVIPADGAQSDHHAAATWLRLDSWLSDIARLPPRHILVMIDACHGGVALSDLHKWRDEGQRPASDLDTLRERRSRRIIVSALDNQRAMDDGPYPGHSLFAGCLIEGLSNGLATGAHHTTTGRELERYLRARIITYPRSTQTPDCGAFELDDRGDIVLPVLSQMIAVEAGDRTLQSPASHPPPPGTHRTAMQASLVTHASTHESLLSSPVSVAASAPQGSPSTVDRFMRPRSDLHGAVTIALVILGICAAFAYSTRNNVIVRDAVATRGPVAAAGDVTAPHKPPSDHDDRSSDSMAAHTPADSTIHKPPGDDGDPPDDSMAGRKSADEDDDPPDDETPPSAMRSHEPPALPAAKPVSTVPGRPDPAASDQVASAVRAHEKAVNEDQKRLIDHIDRQLARTRHDRRYFSYRILRGQLFLLTLVRSVRRPSAEYLASLRGYVDNQLALIKELQIVQSSHGMPDFLGHGRLAPGDERLAESAGVEDPGSYAFVSPHVAMRDLATLLAFGTWPFGVSASLMKARFGGFDDLTEQVMKKAQAGELDDLTELDAMADLIKPICYYKLDPAWSSLATRLLDEALVEIASNEQVDKERETVKTLQEYTRVYLALAQPKQAVSKLQVVLTTYPRAKQFRAVQHELEAILNGEAVTPCRDPR